MLYIQEHEKKTMDKKKKKSTPNIHINWMSMYSYINVACYNVFTHKHGLLQCIHI